MLTLKRIAYDVEMGYKKEGQLLVKAVPLHCFLA